jgi:hypothetical protein
MKNIHCVRSKSYTVIEREHVQEVILRKMQLTSKLEVKNISKMLRVFSEKCPTAHKKNMLVRRKYKYRKCLYKKLCIQTLPAMGWVEFPPVFCAVTEMVADIVNRWLPRRYAPPPNNEAASTLLDSSNNLKPSGTSDDCLLTTRP